MPIVLKIVCDEWIPPFRRRMKRVMLKMYVFSILINEVTEVNLVQYADGSFSASY